MPSVSNLLHRKRLGYVFHLDEKFNSGLKGPVPGISKQLRTKNTPEKTFKILYFQIYNNYEILIHNLC